MHAAAAAGASDPSSISVLLADLKRCSRARDLRGGIQLHQRAVAGGHISHIFVANSLITMYAKCGSIAEARKIFDRIPSPDTVSWNSLISAYTANNQPEKSLETFDRAQTAAIRMNPRTFVAAISACSSLAAARHSKGRHDRAKIFETGKRIHNQAVKLGLCDEFVESTLVDFYSKAGCMPDAQAVFDSMRSRRDSVALNSLLQGYVDNDLCEVALNIFDHQHPSSRSDDPRTYVAAIAACSRLAVRDRGLDQSKWLLKGTSLHGEASMHKCCDIYVENTLVDMYSKFHRMDEARKVFDGMPRRDAVSWTSLMQGYVDNGDNLVALQLFDTLISSFDTKRLKLVDGRTFVVVLSACSNLANLDKERWFERGKALHSTSLSVGSCDVFVENKVVDLYAECGKMAEARAVFDKMARPDVVSWTALAMGYVKNGENEAALEVIRDMAGKGVARNSLTYVAGLMACGNLMAVERGKRFHDEARRQKLEKDVMVSNCLVDFYGKCGCMELAKEVFDTIARKTVVSWTTLMCGYALAGEIERVFKLFKKLKENGVAPNEATFVCVLNACSHAGLTEKGKEYFNAMVGYGVTPSVRHYACVIDLLGRANCLDEALKVLRSMPCEPDVVTWKALLGACQKWKNVEVGEVAYEALVRLNRNEDSAYVLMASIYGVAGMAQECEHVLTSRKQAALCRTCWTDEAGTVHKFVSSFG